MREASFDVIVCGSLHLDIVVKAAALPRLDETVVGTSWAQVCGGKGGNQAMQAARAGARVAMIGRVGTDAFGETLLANLISSDVNVKAIGRDAGQGSGMSVAILQGDGEYGAAIVSGANTAIDPAALGVVWSDLGGARVVVLQNEVPHAVNVAAAKVAHKAGALVVLNAAPARPCPDDLLDHVDVLVVNRIEAEALSGVAVANRGSARMALAALRQGQGQGRGLRAIIVTLGGEGLVVSPPSGEVFEVEALPVKVTSTHGAGDCFVGVLAARLAEGQSLVASCHEANRTAAAFVSRPQS
jgi:ribokinase